MSVNQDLWEIWEWDDIESREAMIQEGGENLTFEQIPEAVRKEITRIHTEVGESTIPYEQFARDDPSSKNVLYSLLPNGKDVPDSFKLARMTNEHIVFGLTAWRKGKNPDYDEDY